MWSITSKMQYSRCILLVCVVLACMAFTGKTYFEKHAITADESAFIFRRVPEKIIAINDSLMVFYTDKKIIVPDYRTGKIKHLFNVNELINRKYIMGRYLHFDTSNKEFRSDDSIFLHGGKPDIWILSMAKNSDADIFLVFLVNSFRMKINGEDTLLDDHYDIFSASLNCNNFSVKNIRPFDLQWDDRNQMFRTPQNGLGVVNNTVYIAYEREPNDNRKILCSYSMSSLTMTKEQPGITHSVYEKIETNGVSTPTWYNFQDIDSEHYVNNVTTVYNLLTEKEVFDCKSYFKYAIVSPFYSPIDKEKRKWFISFYSLRDTVNYHSKINQIQVPISHIAIIDIADKRVLYDNPLADEAVYCRYKNSIISIEQNKKEKKYSYVVYKL